MASNIRNVNETVLVRDGNIGTVWLQFLGDGAGCGARNGYGVSDGKVESKIFNVSGIVLQL